MEYDEAETVVFGDVPPSLEALSKLPERAVGVIRTIGDTVLKAVYSQETATSFDADSAIYAA